MKKRKIKDDLRSYINGEPCDTYYQAELFHKEIRPCEVISYDNWSEDGLFPIDLKDTQFQWSEIYLEYFVEGFNETQTETLVSNLISAHTKCNLRFENLNFTYRCKLAEKPEIEHITVNVKKVMILLKSDYKYKDTIVKLLKAGGETFFQRGNIKTPLIIKLLPKVDVALLDLKINENVIKLQNITNNTEVIVDGSEFTVTKNGVIDFTLVNDLWEFPILLPGDNTVLVDNENIEVSIMYTPRYV